MRPSAVPAPFLSLSHHETFALLVCWYAAVEPGNRQPFMKAARSNARAAFLFKSRQRPYWRDQHALRVWDDPGYGKQMRPL